MESTKHEFIKLRAEGNSFNTIAKKLNKSKGTLIEWNKELAEEIANCKALQLEALYEKYFLLQENRLQLRNSRAKIRKARFRSSFFNTFEK